MHSSTALRILGLACAVAITAGCAGRAAAGDGCTYKGRSYSDGAAACQSGTQYRCDDGDWKSLKIACGDEHPERLSMRACELGGITYSSGSASCQAGTQHRCEDGVWQSLGTACVVGDAPIRAVPGLRTCMFNDATVASNSTICKSGSTFLCSDGNWINLGTACR
jgi:hypothetical protein